MPRLMCPTQAVATASGDATVRLWALADGACLRTFEGHTASVLRVAFLSAGTQARPRTACASMSRCAGCTTEHVLCKDRDTM